MLESIPDTLVGFYWLTQTLIYGQLSAKVSSYFSFIKISFPEADLKQTTHVDVSSSQK